jgi:hypothetical protein
MFPSIDFQSCLCGSYHPLVSMDSGKFVPVRKAWLVRYHLVLLSAKKSIIVAKVLLIWEKKRLGYSPCLPYYWPQWTLPGLKINPREKNFTLPIVPAAMGITGREMGQLPGLCR